MAIDPRIPLGVQAPQIPQVQIRTPLERYQQILTLRGLMEQGELRRAQLESENLQSQLRRQEIADDAAFRARFGTSPTVAPSPAPTPATPAAPLLPSGAGSLGTPSGSVAAPSVPTFSVTATARTPEMSDDEIYRILGPKRGAEFITKREQQRSDKALQESRVAETNAKQAEDLGAVIQGVLDVKTPEAYQFGLNDALRRKLITPDQYREYQNYDIRDPRVQNNLRVLANASVKTAEQWRAKREERAAEGTVSQQMRQGEGTLRQDWLKIATPFQQTVDSYANMQAVREMDAPVADSILVRQMMKLLEPTSAVLGGEQQDIEMRRSLTDWLSSLWGNLKSGHRLTSEQKQQLLQAADNVYGYRQKLYSARAEDYENIARDQKLNPANVVNKFEKGLAVGPRPGSQEAAGVVPEDVKKVLVRLGDGIHTLADGSTWKKEEGVITRIQPEQAPPQTPTSQPQPKAATPQALPGKILVLPPDPGAKPIYIDAAKWSEAQKLGFRKQ